MSIQKRIERYAAAWVRELEPYRVGDAGGLIKLDAMENPYAIPAGLREAWNDVLARVETNRYPDPGACRLKAALRARHGLGDDFGVALGNGSDELIHLLCLAFAGGASSQVLCPEPTFSVYGIAARGVGMGYHGVDLDATDFHLDPGAMLEAIEACEPALVFMASPNNPTGNRLDEDTLHAVCERAPGLVVLDEAYCRFAGSTRMADLRAYENLVIMQTFSKIGLAGLRVGVLFGAQAWIDLVERLRMPYNINSLSQAGACFALEHDAAFQPQIDTIVGERERLYGALQGIPGVHAWPSLTNFILFRTPRGSGGRVFESLKAHGVLVRNLTGAHAQLEDCLRVTVGTPEENRSFLKALEASLT